MENDTTGNDRPLRPANGLAKVVEIGVLCSITPYLLHDLTVLRKPLAYGLGVFLGAMVTYVLPPRSTLGFMKWLALSIAAAIFIYAYAAVLG
jgi:hypothetical protein